MAFITKQEMTKIIEGRPEGTNPVDIITILREQGHKLEGFEQDHPSPGDFLKKMDQQVQRFGNASGRLGVGMMKGLMSSIFNMNKLAEQGLKKTGIERFIGDIDIGEKPEFLETEEGLEKLGFGAEQILEFMTPISGGTRLKMMTELFRSKGNVDAVRRILSKVGGEVAEFTGKEFVQSGSVEHLRDVAIISAVIPAASGIFRETGIIPQEFRKAMSERIINSLIRPLEKQFRYGKNPGRGVAEEGIIANSLEDLERQISRRLTGRTNQLNGVYDSAKYKDTTLDVVEFIEPIEALFRKALETPRTSQLSGLTKRINAIRNDLLQVKLDPKTGEIASFRNFKDITLKEAVELKRLIGEMTKWTGNITDDDLINAALRKAYGVLNKKILAVAPETEFLNERIGDLISAKIAAQHRNVLAQRANLIPIGAEVIGLGSGITALIASGGAVTPAILIGVSVATLKIQLGKPAIKTRVATWLAKSTKDERDEVFKKVPFLKAAIIEEFGDGVFDDLLQGQRADCGKTEESKKKELIPKIKEVEKPVGIIPAEQERIDEFRKSISTGLRRIGDLLSFFTEPDPRVTAQEPEELGRFKETFSPDILPFGALRRKIIQETVEGVGGLTTKTIERLRGKEFVSKQFIEDLTRMKDVRKVDRELILEKLKEFGEKVNIKKFVNKVKLELLDLNKFGTVRDQRTTRYSGIRLSDEIRGPTKEYEELIYLSPIENRAGEIHFNHLPSEIKEKYFAHVRTERLIEKKNKITRDIEIQSDLFQKGALRERIENLKFRGEKTASKRIAELQQLQIYENIWHERILRERIRDVAKKGDNIYRVPTGETAMKIEGLGEAETFSDVLTGKILRAEGGLEAVSRNHIPPRVGQEIIRGETSESWIITDVLEEGRFKAVPKSEMIDTFDKIDPEELKLVRQRFEEQFDISGKIDPNNPIFKFYENDIGKFLKNKFSATRITDSRGVDWWEVKITPNMAKDPIEAFGIIPFLRRDKED